MNIGNSTLTLGAVNELTVRKANHNAGYAMMGRTLVVAQAVMVGEDLHETPSGDFVRSIVANLMHYCDKENLSFQEALESAREHYNEETE